MPAIRDWSYNYTSATALTITVPLPKYEVGDLLLAVLSTDTTAQTWTCADWTQLFSVTNIPNLGIMYKIAVASEPEPTFTYTGLETANGAILSIRDVDPLAIFADYDTANTTAFRQAMPISVAARNNSLIIYCCNHGVPIIIIPSIIEGPVTQICSKDGSAHVDGIAWGFQASLGNTPSNVYFTFSGATTTYRGVQATIVINPPETGATVIPTYCAVDNSIYVDPIHGVTAFLGNAAFAGTALTYWTSPLAGRTLANAAASAKTDYGINTYRSCGGMTGPTAANTYLGATIVLLDANRVDITGKNVLVHCMPLLPADIQTVYDTGLGKGIEVGMASSLDNGIVWHVHGFNTPWGVKRVPIIVNEANTSGVIDTRGTFAKTLTKIFGFFTCGFIASSDWTWTMIWVLNTTVVAGGTTSEPIDILGIVRTIADGHERISALQQAKNQMLLLQPIQIGDGGTNKTVLKLESTAIEFPEIYNLATRQTYYCSVPNVAGITYYAGANDSITHKDSIISSPSKYHWKFDAGCSANATYDFSGLVLINAGTIVLNANVNLAIVSFLGCSKITAIGNILDDCTIANSSDQAALEVSAVAQVTGKIKNSYFLNNNRAIKITMAGTYEFDNLYFSGNTYDIENLSSGLVTINCINGSNATTYINTGGGSTVIVNTKILTLTGLIAGSEIVILEAGTTNVLVDEETSGTSYDYGYNYIANTHVDIIVHSLGYEYMIILNYLLPNANSSIPISQRFDRNYYNP